ncbi:MAG: SMC-Scp complex subunit ScpB [bacterium]
MSDPANNSKPQLEYRQLKPAIEAALLACGGTISVKQMVQLFSPQGAIEKADIQAALDEIGAECEQRGVELVEVATGYRMQIKQDVFPWIARLWEERPPRYSRALLETLSIIAYQQPVTRGEIEKVRGVSVSSQIIRTLDERDWIRVVGHRDVPGRPALFGTTKAFLDYFSLTSLADLPTLSEIKDLENMEPELDFSKQS